METDIFFLLLPKMYVSRKVLYRRWRVVNKLEWTSYERSTLK